MSDEICYTATCGQGHSWDVFAEPKELDALWSDTRAPNMDDELVQSLVCPTCNPQRFASYVEERESLA